MKLLITGHTYGLGKFLFDALKDSYEIKGISRSTGYDLTDREVVKKVINESLEFDHVLNVCKVSPAQTDLLLGIFSLWERNSKYGKIISIGTLSETFSWNLIRQVDVHQTEYISAKHNLAKVHFDLSTVEPYKQQPQSVLIRPLNIGQSGSRGEPYLTETEVLEAVRYSLESQAYISTIDLRKLKVDSN